MIPASQFTFGYGPTANEALAEPVVLAASWLGAGPPWALVFVVGLALAMVSLPTRSSLQR